MHEILDGKLDQIVYKLQQPSIFNFFDEKLKINSKKSFLNGINIKE